MRNGYYIAVNQVVAMTVKLYIYRVNDWYVMYNIRLEPMEHKSTIHNNKNYTEIKESHA